MHVGFVIASKPITLSARRRSMGRTLPRRNTSPKCAFSPPTRPEDAGKTITRRDAIRLLAGMGAAAFTLTGDAPKAGAYSRETDFLYDSKSGSFVPPSAMDSLLRRDAGATFDRCIVAGEIHDNMLTHNAQLAVIDSARRMSDGKQLIVGFEQFYRNHNRLLDDYVQGKISTDSLLERAEWDYIWGFDANLYTPIFEYCQLHGIRMRGLNVPWPLVSIVTKFGLEGLPQELKVFLPDKMDLDNRDHYEHFVRMMTNEHSGVSHKAVLDRYYEVQVLWEEWMSQSVAQSLEGNPDTRMVALIGSGHVECRYGFPDRIEKRCNERPYTIVPRPVAWTHDDGCYLPNIPSPDRDVADLVWYTRRRVDVV